MTTPAVAGLLGAIGVLHIVASTIAGSVTTEVQGIRVEVRSTPDTPGTDRKTTYAVRLTDSSGNPVTDARVTLLARMADGMAAAAPLRAAAGESGLYCGEVLFTMAGPWELTIRVLRPGGGLAIPLREEVARRR